MLGSNGRCHGSAYTREGKQPVPPTEAVAHVLPSSKFLQNVGLEPAAPNRSATAARVQELEVEVAAEGSCCST